jgi:hypothetical protein
MTRTQTTNTQRSRRIAGMLRWLALFGVLLVAAAAPAAPRLRPNFRPQTATTGQVAGAPAPPTVVKETVIKRTDDHPALPIVLSAAALALALAAAAYTLAHRDQRRGATRT